jgi:hypothetical protein
MSKRLFLCVFLISFFTSFLTVHAEIEDFEDFPLGPLGIGYDLYGEYGSFEWQNFSTYTENWINDNSWSDPNLSFPSGNVAVGSIPAYPFPGTPVLTSDRDFNFTGAYFTGIDGFEPSMASGITISGYNDGSFVGSISADIQRDEFDYLNADLQGIDELRFEALNGYGSPDGRWLMDDFEYTFEPTTYGIFAGIHDEVSGSFNDNRADLDAIGFSDQLIEQNVLLEENTTVLAGEQVTVSQVLDAIEAVTRLMTPEDKLILHLSGHGTVGNDWGESAVAYYVGYLWDDMLSVYLQDISDSEKWIFVDSCFAGGFWEDDFEDLSNIALFAAADQFSTTQFSPWTGRGLFTNALIDAYDIGIGGYWLADDNHNWEMEFDELESFLAYWTRPDGLEPFVMERDYGDLIAYSDDLINFASYASDDFTGRIQGAAPVPEPSTIVLMGLGLVGLAGFGRKRFRK